METKSYEIAIDPKLEHEARAEKVSLAAGLADNPWRGAAKRLEAAQKAARDHEKALNAEAERREGEELKDALFVHRGLCGQIDTLARELDELRRVSDPEADHHNRQYLGWRRIYGAEFFLDRASLTHLGNHQAAPDELPENHYLRQVGPEMAERMRKASERDQKREQQGHLHASFQGQRQQLEEKFPVLAYCREEDAA